MMDPIETTSAFFKLVLTLELTWERRWNTWRSHKRYGYL